MHSHGTSIPHVRGRLTSRALGLLFALWTAMAGAIGPTLPLRFDEALVSRDPMRAALIVDPEQIRIVKIERQVYVDGALVHAEPVEAQYARPVPKKHRKKEMRAYLPLEFKGARDMKERRVFTQKLVIEGEWLHEEASKPLYVQRWFYFAWEGERLVQISQQEYARLTDPPEYERAPDGRRRPIARGRDLKADVPLPQTKASPALPAGAALEERPSAEGRPDQPAQPYERDRSEIDEK